MVTEQPQYSVVVCIFSTSQNTEISLIPNGLRLIYTCSLLLALPCIFHSARHSYATALLTSDIPLPVIKEMLGHSDIKVTQIYAKVVDSKKDEVVNCLNKLYHG